MYFVNYSRIEKHIFNHVKNYFEALPSFGSDDYKNAFYDLVAQFGDGGNSYLYVSNEYERLITLQIIEAIGRFDIEDKEELQDFYEQHFLENYYDQEAEKYFYSDHDLVSQVTDRFKAWIDDNFNLENLFEEDSDYDEEEALQYSTAQTEDAVDFIKRVIRILLGKQINEIGRRLLDISQIYLSYHPWPPDEGFNLTISYKGETLKYEIVYSSNHISCSQYYTDEGSVFYDYKLTCSLGGSKEEEGDWLQFVYNAEQVLILTEAEKVSIYNEWI